MKKSNHGMGGGRTTLSCSKEGRVAFGVPLGQSCINPKVLAFVMLDMLACTSF